MPLKVEYKSNRSSTMETEVRYIISMAGYRAGAAPFHEYFKAEMETMKKCNGQYPQFLYVAFFDEYTGITEVWKMNSADEKERLVAIVSWE